jgi:hypothetical protein
MKEFSGLRSTKYRPAVNSQVTSTKLVAAGLMMKADNEQSALPYPKEEFPLRIINGGVKTSLPVVIPQELTKESQQIGSTRCKSSRRK